MIHALVFEKFLFIIFLMLYGQRFHNFILIINFFYITSHSKFFYRLLIPVFYKNKYLLKN